MFRAARAWLAILVALIAFLAMLDFAVAADGDELALVAAAAVGVAVELGPEVALLVGSLDDAGSVLVGEVGDRGWLTYPSPHTPPQTPSGHFGLVGLDTAPPTRRARKRLLYRMM